MPWIADGAPLRRSPDAHEAVIAVGWLDGPKPYARGPVPGAFVEQLRDLCRNPVNLMRGWHSCTLCETPAHPIRVRGPEDEFLVGHGEIRVRGPSGAVYGSPDMVVHYVEEHGYQPPEDYVQGVLDSGRR